MPKLERCHIPRTERAQMAIIVTQKPISRREFDRIPVDEAKRYVKNYNEVK